MSILKEIGVVAFIAFLVALAVIAAKGVDVKLGFDASFTSQVEKAK